MLVVDSSVWIDVLRRDPLVVKLVAAERNRIIVGDLILMEVLRGARDEERATRIERDLRQFPVVPLGGREVAVQSAHNYRRLRSLGVTPRSAIDVVVATYCILRRHELVHRDRDFQPMVEHLGLRAISA